MGPFEVIFTSNAVNNNIGDKMIKPRIAAIESNILLAMAYVLRIKAMNIPKKPLPKRAIVPGSGARDLDSCPNCEGISESCTLINEGDISSDLMKEIVAQAVLTHKMQAPTKIATDANFLNFFLFFFMVISY